MIPFSTNEDYTSPGWTLDDKIMHFLPSTLLHLSYENLALSSYENLFSGNNSGIVSSLSFSNTPFFPVIVMSSTFLSSKE